MKSTEIWLAEVHWKQMLADVRKQVPLEACGLVGGVDLHSRVVYPIRNIHQSPVRFLMDPQEQLQAMQALDDRHWDLLAIYHSHPHGPATPSPTDLAQASYPEAVSLIWSQQKNSWSLRGFLITELNYQEIPVHISQNSYLEI